MYKAGGYSGTSTANEDLIPILKSHEGAETPFILKDTSILPTSDCHIIVNGGTQIFVPSSGGYSNNNIYITSLKIVESDIAFNIAYNY